MEATFMSIHNLTPEANILFASESIVDILGFLPHEVAGRSCFDYFHPDEVPFARHIHNRGVKLDKAAVLHYARIRDRNGNWVGCECVFTIVYEVLVACTSIYRGDIKSQRRAMDAPTIRRLFASSPRDPRYHMLEHLSAKFRAPPQPSLLEPRAALILNRFTRTLTVMYATNAVSNLLGISPEQFKDKSFYECMQENCLPDAIRCLESAKANDSIAYLRFWYRDPRRPEDGDQEMREASQSSDSEDGGVNLSDHMDHEPESHARPSISHSGDSDQHGYVSSNMSADNARIYSDESTDQEHDAPSAIFDRPRPVTMNSSSSSIAVTPDVPRRQRPHVPHPRPVVEPYELEAVVSCTSDGLVVILRRARPLNRTLQQPALPPRVNVDGLFAAPWGINPIRPHRYQPDQLNHFQHGLQAPQVPVGGPPVEDFMISIREVAVFAWALAGINGNIASYGRGMSWGEAQPPSGLPVWSPYAQPSPSYFPPQNQAMQRWARIGHGVHHQPMINVNLHVKGNESAAMMSYTQPSRDERFAPQHGYSQSSGQMEMGSHMDAPPAYASEAKIQNDYQTIQSQNLRSEHAGQGQQQKPAFEPVQENTNTNIVMNMDGDAGIDPLQQKDEQRQQQQQEYQLRYQEHQQPYVDSDPSLPPSSEQSGEATSGEGIIAEGSRNNRSLWY